MCITQISTTPTTDDCCSHNEYPKDQAQGAGSYHKSEVPAFDVKVIGTQKQRYEVELSKTSLKDLEFVEPRDSAAIHVKMRETVLHLLKSKQIGKLPHQKTRGDD